MSESRLPTIQPSDDADTLVIALVKKHERYVFLYTAESKAEVLRTIGRFAADPDLEFTWWDAAMVSKKVRQLAGTE